MIETALTKVEEDAKNLIVFSQKKEDLLAMVKISSKITVDDLRNKEQVEIAKGMKIKLRKAEIDIEKEGKGYRDVFTAVNRHISSEEKSLKEITSPEIDRLDAIVEEAKQIAITEKRKELLPAMRAKLETIGDRLHILDEDLLKMDPIVFEAYYNQRVADKNEAERARIEAEREAEGERIRLEQQAQADALKAREDEIKAKEQVLQNEIDARAREEKARADERVRLENEAKEKAEQEAKDKADAEAKALAEKEKLEKAEAYRSFRAENGWTEQTKADYKEENTGELVILWKKVGEFKIK